MQVRGNQKVISALLAAAFASGCASGGGGSGDASPQLPPPQKKETKSASKSKCGSGGFDTLIFGGWCPTPEVGTQEYWDLVYEKLGINGSGTSAASIAPAAPARLFTSWQEMAAGTKATAQDVRTGL